MAIATIDQYIGSNRQRIQFFKNAALTTVANGWYSNFVGSGNPGAGTLAGTGTPGAVPVGGATPTAGFPAIPGGSGSYYLTKVEFSSTVAGRIALFDCLWKSGGYLYNASGATVNSNYDNSRVPAGGGGTRAGWAGLEIWIETQIAPTGNQTFSVTYDPGDGTTSTSPAMGIFPAGAPAISRSWQLPFLAGDYGVKQVKTITGAVGTTQGTFNILVLRPLWMGRVNVVNGGDTHDLLRTGMPLIYQNTALMCMVAADSTAFPNPLDLIIEVASA